MKKILLTFLILIVIVISACADETENIAQTVTLEEVKQNPDFFWFMAGYNNFNVSQPLLLDIKQAFIPEKHSFLIYTESNCLCGSDYLKFPALIKVLDSADISSDYYQIFIVQNTDAQHPYSNIFRLSRTPTFIILREGKFVYSVNDTLLLKYNFLQEPNRLEEVLLEGLKIP